MPALSVSWGPWAGAGMAARLDERLAQSIERRGVTPLRPGTAMRALLGVLAQPVAHTMICEFDWVRFIAGRDNREQTEHFLDVVARANKLAGVAA